MAAARRMRQRCAAELAPDADYIHRHHVRTSDRTVAANWIYEIADDDGHTSTEAQLAVWLVDRFLSLFDQPVVRERLQLVASAALLVATKYEAPHAISIARLEYLSADTCKQDDIVRVENTLLRTVEHRLMWPTFNEWFGVQTSRDPTAMEQLVLDLATLSYRLAVQTEPLRAVGACREIARLAATPPRARRGGLPPTTLALGRWMRWVLGKGGAHTSAFQVRCPVELAALRAYVQSDRRYDAVTADGSSGSVST